MQDEINKHLDRLWKQNAAASANLQKIVDAQAALAEKRLMGIVNTNMELELWREYEKALKLVLEIGAQLQQTAQDAGIFPPPSN